MAVPEGTPVFPGEPLVTVAGPMIQAQFVETMILLTINHQTLIATKANRSRVRQKAVLYSSSAPAVHRATTALSSVPRCLHRRLSGHGLRSVRP